MPTQYVQACMHSWHTHTYKHACMQMRIFRHIYIYCTGWKRFYQRTFAQCRGLCLGCLDHLNPKVRQDRHAQTRSNTVLAAHGPRTSAKRECIAPLELRSLPLSKVKRRDRSDVIFTYGFVRFSSFIVLTTFLTVAFGHATQTHLSVGSTVGHFDI